ncbi:NAD-dependent epimerase/dehydratase family protein [bacterium]|nr:NAD-dependent epimerase/dehydratase family protein [bacterium]
MVKKTVLVTGGAGFIGKHTVNNLIQEGFEPIIVDRKEKTEDIKCKFYQMDVTSEKLETVFKENKIDYVIHLAALPSVAESIKKPLKDCMDNYYATVNVCTYSQKYNVKKIIFSSTAAVYANPKYLPVDEDHPTDYLSPYAITKNASENFIKFSGLDYIIFRYANVYGPGQDSQGEAGVVAKFFELMSNNKPIEIHGNGEQYRDFIYVEDVARVNVLALKNQITNTIINVSTNTRTSVNELYQYLKSGLNYSLEAKHTESRLGDIPKSVLDNKKLVKLFNYIPEIGIKEGLTKMIKDMNDK